uniref:Uncharacterized protein n=1 Tax=Setaria viridis TaxID=4556 RepID=A0A4U6T9E7_SETVI|nr:hypothetical protein SEVIR_9G566950v2 [Setaria viridis]
MFPRQRRRVASEGGKRWWERTVRDAGPATPGIAVAAELRLEK